MNSCACGCGAGVRRRFVHGHNGRGAASSLWRGGGSAPTVKGYRTKWAPEHARPSGAAHVLEHIIIAERAVGRTLTRDTPVHHVNGNRADNRSGNLVVCQSVAYHHLLHARTDALRATGNPRARRCTYCKEWGALEADGGPLVTVNRSRPRTVPECYHRECNREHVRLAFMRRKVSAGPVKP